MDIKDILKGLDRLLLSLDKLKESQAKTDEQMKKTDEKLDKLKESQAKTDEQMKKTDEKLDKLKESQAKTDEQMKKTDEQIKENAVQMKKTDEKLDRLCVRYGGLSNTQGKIVEDSFYDSVKDDMTIGEYKFDEITRNTKIPNKGEFDISLLNGNTACLVSVKTNPKIEDIDSLLSKEITLFKTIHRSYDEYVAVIAGSTMDDDVRDYAAARGVFVYRQVNQTFQPELIDGFKAMSL